jgi:MFS family permease
LYSRTRGAYPSGWFQSPLNNKKSMRTFSQIEPAQRRSLLVLFGTGLLFWTSIAILLPTLPAYLDTIDINQQQIGLIIGAFAIGLLATRPYMGKLADRRGRKLVLLIGTAIVAIAPLGYLATTSIPLLMIIRAFHGISIAALTTAYSALVVDLAPPERRGEVIGTMSLANPIGVALGPAIGGYLQVSGMFSTIFWISILCGALSYLCASQLREQRPIKIEPDWNDSSAIVLKVEPSNLSVRQILTNRALGIPALILLLIGCPFGAVHTFIPLYIQASKIDLNPGLFYTIAAISSFCARSVIGSRSDRYGRGIFIALSLCCYTGAMALLANAQGDLSFIGAAILEGLGIGTLIPMTVALLSDRSLSHQRGQILSICLAGLDLGVAVAAPVFGMVADQLGYAGIFTVGTGLGFSAIVVFLIWGNHSLQRSIGFCLGRDRDYYRQS